MFAHLQGPSQGLKTVLVNQSSSCRLTGDLWGQWENWRNRPLGRRPGRIRGEPTPAARLGHPDVCASGSISKGPSVGSVIKKRRKRMAKKKHRKLLKKTRIQRRRQGK
jgi:hypothetical protein